MAEGINQFGSIIGEIYNLFLESLPLWAQNFVNIFLIVLLITIYSIFIWKLYRFLAKKNLFKMNIHQKESGKFMNKITYFVEYLLAIPFMVFIWFSIFTLFLMFLTEGLELEKLLVVSAVIISAIRMAAYYKEDLAKDLGKLLPFTLLGVALTQSTSLGFSKALEQLSQLPTFFSEIFIYLAFIVLLEFFLRVLDVLFVSSGISHEEEVLETD